MNQTIEEQRLKEIAEQFKKEFEENRQKMIDEYRKEFDNHLTPDNALYLCKEYKDNPELRIKLDSELRDTANKIKNAVWDEMIQEKPEKEMAVFITGGSGSGKSTTNEILEPVRENADVVNEVIKGLNENRVEEALKSGRDVAIIYVHRPIEKATEGIIQRAEDGKHIPDLNYHAEGNFETQKKFLDLAEKYKDNPKVHFITVNNSGEKEDLKVINSQEKSVEFVKNNAYTSIEEVKDRAFRSYENVREQREQQGKPLGENIRTALFPSPNEERRFQESVENRGTLRGEYEETNRVGRSGEAKEKGEQVKNTESLIYDEFSVSKISDNQVKVTLPNGDSRTLNKSLEEFQDDFRYSFQHKEFREKFAKDLFSEDSAEKNSDTKAPKSEIINPLSIQVDATQSNNQTIKNTQSQ